MLHISFYRSEKFVQLQAATLHQFILHIDLLNYTTDVHENFQSCDVSEVKSVQRENEEETSDEQLYFRLHKHWINVV